MLQTFLIRYFKVSLLLAILFSILLLQNCHKSNKQEQSEKKLVVAKVDDEPITYEDFTNKYEQIKEQVDILTLEQSKFKEIKQNIVDQLIISKILFKEAKNLDINITEDEINQEIKNINKSYTKEQLRRLLLSKNLNIEKIKSNIREYLLIKKITNEISKHKIDISEEEIKKYYNDNKNQFIKNKQIRLQQIVVPSMDMAKDILNRLNKGEVFEELAKKYSTGPEAIKGGDLGFFEKGQMIPEFDMAFSLPKNKLSQIIQSNYGYHIFRVIDEKPAQNISLAEAKNKIISILTEQQKNLLYKKWLEEKLTKVKIYKNHELIDKIK